MVGLPEPVRAKLSKICGRLASPHDGERATAAAMASRVLSEHGITWSDVFDGIDVGSYTVPRASPPASPRIYHAFVVAALLRAVATRPDLLTDWELKFCEGIESRATLSVKQARTLVNLCDKVDRTIGSSWRMNDAPRDARAAT